MLILTTNATFADQSSLQIITVNYDPLGSDTNNEWVELYNPSLLPIDLTTILLQTGNGAVENSWRSAWQGNTLLLPLQTYVVGEPQWVDAQVTLDLQNGPDAVRVVYSTTNDVIDVIGWGEHEHDEYYEGNPAPDEGDGYALLRNCNYSASWQCDDTDNNSDDFTSFFNVTPQMLPAWDPLVNEWQLASPIVTIDSVVLTDDNSAEQGVQLLPADRQRMVPMNVTIASATGNHTVVFNVSGPFGDYGFEKQLTCVGSCVLETTLPIPARSSAGDATITVTVDSSTYVALAEIISVSLLEYSIEEDIRYVGGDWYLGNLILENIADQDVAASVLVTTTNQTLITLGTALYSSIVQVTLESGERVLIPLQISSQELLLGQSLAFETHTWVFVR